MVGDKGISDLGQVRAPLAQLPQQLLCHGLPASHLKLPGCEGNSFALATRVTLARSLDVVFFQNIEFGDTWLLRKTRRTKHMKHQRVHAVQGHT